MGKNQSKKPSPDVSGNKKRDKNENLKPFTSTHQPNNNGRPKKFITAVTEATGYKKSQVNDCYLTMLKLPMLELKRIADDPKTPSLEVLVARGIHGDAKRGELKNLESMLNRAIGKPIDKTEHSGEIQVDIYQNLSKAELKKELDKLGLSDKLFDK